MLILLFGVEMSKSKKEKSRLLKILNLNEDYSNMKEEHLKIRYRFYGSIPKKSLSFFFKNSMISERCKQLISESLKKNIPRLLLPIAKQLGEFEYQVNIRCYLKNGFKNKQEKNFSINLSLNLLSNDKKKFSKVWGVYKKNRIVYLGSISFNNEDRVKNQTPFLKGSFAKISELCKKRISELDNESNMWLIPNINFHNSEKFALSHIKKHTDFCEMREYLIKTLRRIKSEFDFDIEEDLDCQLTFYYKIGEQCYWSVSLEENLSFNTLITSFGKDKKEVILSYKRIQDISIVNIVKIFEEYGFLENRNEDITDENVGDVLMYAKMVKY